MKTFFIDLDDTLYPPSSGIWDRIRQRMGLYMRKRLGIPEADIQPLRRQYFELYGTTMRGLEMVYHIDTEDYLAFVHDVPVEDCISPDPLLGEVLRAFPQQKIIFTNADANHAERVLAALELRDCFAQIIDIRQLSPYCKPQPEAYARALALAGETDPAACLMADDSERNIEAARQAGLYCVLVGKTGPNPFAHQTIFSLRDLPSVLSPDLA